MQRNLHKICFSGRHLLKYDPKMGTGSGDAPALLAGIAPLGFDPDCEMGQIHTAECRE